MIEVLVAVARKCMVLDPVQGISEQHYSRRHSKFHIYEN